MENESSCSSCGEILEQNVHLSILYLDGYEKEIRMNEVKE